MKRKTAIGLTLAAGAAAALGLLAKNCLEKCGKECCAPAPAKPKRKRTATKRKKRK